MPKVLRLVVLVAGASVVLALALAEVVETVAGLPAHTSFIPATLREPPTPTTAPTMTPTAAPTAAPTATPTRPPSCHPSYPTVCIPAPPPNLNCDDVPYVDFQVLPPDPHGFDGNENGIGCESD
jgi:hypothetical protein